MAMPKNLKIPDGMALGASEPNIMRALTKGDHRTGKTFIIKNAPALIGVLPCDLNTRTTIETMEKEVGRKFLLPKKDLLRVAGLENLGGSVSRSRKADMAQLGEELTKEQKDITKKEIGLYRDHIEEVTEYYDKFIAHPDVRVIMIDNGKQLYEDIYSAHWGRSYRITPRDRWVADAEYEDFFKKAAAAHKHLIVTHQAKDKWRNGKPVPGERVHEGYVATPRLCNVELEHEKLETDEELKWLAKKLSNDEEVRSWKEFPKPSYILKISRCTKNPLLVADSAILVNEEIDFRVLAMRIYEGTEAEDWE